MLGPGAIAGAVLIALTAWRLVALELSPLTLMFDEAQYWTWAKAPAFGYFSKPPMVAWLIAFTTSLCGDGEACVRSRLAAAASRHRVRGLAAGDAPVRTARGRGGGGGLRDHARSELSVRFHLDRHASAAVLGPRRPRAAPGRVPRPDAGLGRLRIRVRPGNAQQVHHGSDAALRGVVPGAVACPPRAGGGTLDWRSASLSRCACWRRTSSGMRSTVSSACVTSATTRVSADPWCARTSWVRSSPPSSQSSGPILFTVFLWISIGGRRLAAGDSRIPYLLCLSLPVLLVMLVQSLLSRAHANWAIVTYVPGERPRRLVPLRPPPDRAGPRPSRCMSRPCRSSITTMR